MNNHPIDENRLADIERFVSENESAIVRDIARLVSIPSIEGPAAEGAPFGVESRQALDCALQIAEELGLEAVNCENKIGYAAGRAASAVHRHGRLHQQAAAQPGRRVQEHSRRSRIR